MPRVNERTQPSVPIIPREAIREHWTALTAGISSTLTAIGSLARCLPLFFSARPRTPLRVLCIIAFDTLSRLRSGKPLLQWQRQTLAALLDFGACVNAAFDNKGYCPHEYRNTLQLLEAAGIRSSVAKYLRRLRDLERSRPLPGGGSWHFQKVALYREEVIRLSLGMVAATAARRPCLDDAIRALDCDPDLNLLFRIVMQCQIIDDVLDYSQDLSTGLPSFLTASLSLPQALERTRLAALTYADARFPPRTGDNFPFRAALFLVSLCTNPVIALAHWRHRTSLELQDTERDDRHRPSSSVKMFVPILSSPAARCHTDPG